MTQANLTNARRINAAVEQFLLRRLRGDAVTVPEFALAYPALGAALPSRLREAELVAAAVRDRSMNNRWT